MRFSPLVLACAASLALSAGFSVARADSPSDYDTAQGHFYRQAAGQTGAGYSITDEGGIPMWSEFQRLGAVDALGYPISNRFVYDGRVVQLTQKVGLVWFPEANQVRFLNIFRILHDAGKDPWLMLKGIPPEANWPGEAGKSWAEISQERYRLLDSNPTVKTSYFGMDDPVNMYGLPTSEWLNTPWETALRFENVVFQQWKMPLPWASPGQLQLANGGDLLKESGVLGSAPFNPQTVPPPALQAVAAGSAVVSFYADSFAGHFTSNGDLFLQSKMICATNGFPLGIRLRLSTLDGKRSVVCTNEDRPAQWNSRIDLSKTAFQRLFPLSSGIGLAKVEILK